MHTSKLFLVLAISGFAVCAQGANGNHDRAWWAATSPDGVQRINIRCGPNFFDPAHIVVKANVPVELSVSTTPGLPAHSFVISVAGSRPINADTPIGPTEKAFAFVPGRPGDYQAVCRDNAKVPGASLAKAKQGVLTVIP
jgi:hypothetical protein